MDEAPIEVEPPDPVLVVDEVLDEALLDVVAPPVPPVPLVVVEAPPAPPVEDDELVAPPVPPVPPALLVEVEVDALLDELVAPPALPVDVDVDEPPLLVDAPPPDDEQLATKPSSTMAAPRTCSTLMRPPRWSADPPE